MFEKKIALVTGSGRGIGKAIALHFARLGADLIIHYFRHRLQAEETAQEIRQLGRAAWIVKADLGEIADIEAMFSDIEKQLSSALPEAGLDFLIHNAASGYNHPVMKQKPRGWDWTMNINARSLLFLAQRSVRLMERRGGGVIVSISSPGAVRVLPDYSVVGASKAAIEALTRYLAVELAPKNIVVNAVSPGMVLTDALKHFDRTRSEEGIIAHDIAQTPAGRMVTPEDVAGVVAFLCTPAASMIRGQTILMDGGYTLPVN